MPTRTTRTSGTTTSSSPKALGSTHGSSTAWDNTTGHSITGLTGHMCASRAVLETTRRALEAGGMGSVGSSHFDFDTGMQEHAWGMR